MYFASGQFSDLHVDRQAAAEVPVRIPFSRPCSGTAEILGAARVLNSPWWTMGPEVSAFEQEAAEMLRVPEGCECVAVSSCTAALYLLLKAHGVGPEWTAIVPDLTFCATANAAIAVGAKVELCDVDERGMLDLCRYLAGLAGKIVSLPVHFAGAAYGNEGFGLVIHDQAHSFAPFHGLANSAFSFFPTKNISGGEGGLVVAGKPIADKIRQLRNHGRASTYEVAEPGALNFRMSDLTAAVLRVQLKRLPDMLVRKAQIEAQYRQGLEGVVKLPPRGVTHLFWIRHPERDRIKAELAAQGIETSIHYKPLHELGYGPNEAERFPMASTIAAQTLSLPFHPLLTNHEVETVIEAVKRASYENQL